MFGIINILFLIFNTLFLVVMLLKIKRSASTTKKGRLGVIKGRFHDGRYTRDLAPNYVDVIVIVEEIGRVADQSEIEILSIDHSSLNKDEVENSVKLHYGHYWKTDEILWNQDKPEKDDVTKIIETPMDELVKKIASENIKDA